MSALYSLCQALPYRVVESNWWDWTLHGDTESELREWIHD